MKRVYRHTVLILLASVAVGCGPQEAPSHKEKVRPAKLVTVTAASVDRNLTFPAVVRAVQTAELTFQLAGQVNVLSVLEGEEVVEGDVIAQLDQRDARNNLAQEEAEYNNAQSEFRRAQRLAAEEAISISLLESRQTQLEISQAAVSTARKALEDTVIRAPFSGAVSRVYIEQFQNVQAKEPVAILQSAKTEAIVSIPGTILSRIPQLEPVNNRVVLDAAPEIELPATFREASGVADQATQTYQISFTFVPPEGLLILPGMTASVRTTFVVRDSESNIARGVAVPLAAILAEGDSRYVWFVNDAMRLEKRLVSVDSDISDNVVVTAGLDGGETIVAAGVSFLHEGMTVSAWVSD